MLNSEASTTKSHYRSSKDVIVSPPSNKFDNGEHLASPWYFLITGLSQDVVDALIQLAVCSSTELTIFFTPFQQTLPSYICTIKNLTYLDTPESNMPAAALVCSMITSNPDISSFIHSWLPDPDAEAVIKVLRSIQVSSLKIAISPGDFRTIWNIYCDDPPHLSFDDFHAWTDQIRNLCFNSLDYGVGTP